VFQYRCMRFSPKNDHGGLASGGRADRGAAGPPCGCPAARGKYRRAPETMKKRESLLFLQTVKPGHALMPIGGGVLSGVWVIFQAVYQYGAKARLARGVEFFHHVG